jgi:hypothetical protein
VPPPHFPLRLYGNPSIHPSIIQQCSL